jgi:hypothetical protein
MLKRKAAVPNLRAPYWDEDPWFLDIEASMQLMRCDHRPVPPEYEPNEAWVQPMMDRFTEDEQEWISRLAHLAVQLKEPTKPLYELGNKYVDALTRPPRHPVVWLLCDTKEQRMRHFLRVLPFVLEMDMATKHRSGAVYNEEEDEERSGGDFRIVFSDASLVHIAERKAFADLMGSTRSGHKKAQIATLQQSGIPLRNVEWILEAPDRVVNGCEACERQRHYTLADREALASNARNLRVRDGFAVVTTSGMLETLYHLLKTLQGFQLQRPSFQVEPMAHPLDLARAEDIKPLVQQLLDAYADKVRVLQTANHFQREAKQKLDASRKQSGPKRKRCEGTTQEFGNMLTTLDRVTSATAADVIHVYPRLRNLVDAYREAEEPFRSNASTLASSGSLCTPQAPLSSEAEPCAKDSTDKPLLVSRVLGHDTTTLAPDDEPLFPNVPEDDDNPGEEADSLFANESVCNDEVKDDDVEKAEDSPSSTKTSKKKTRKRKGTESSKPTKRKKKTRDRIATLALLLENLPLQNGKRLGPTLSGSIWRVCYATEEDEAVWAEHPSNPVYKAQKAKQRKEARETGDME